MRRNVLNTLVLAGLVCGILAAAGPPAAAQDDARKEARMLTLEGKFSAVTDLLQAAPEEVRNDPKLRMRLGDMALKWTKRQDGPDKVPGLVAAKTHFAVALDVNGADVDAATAAIETGLELVELEIEAKQPTRALVHANWSVKIGEAALAGGSDVPELRLAVAAARTHRAKLSHKIEDFDRIVSDYDRSAELSVSCAETARKPARALGTAARVYLDLAAFISEGRPIKEEVRDEAALVKALDTALRACETKGAADDEYTVHLLALIAIHRAKKEGSVFEREDFGRPFMQELGGREGVKGLDLYLPKADGWRRLDKSGAWDRVYERQLEGDTSAVQFMIKGYSFSEKYGGKGYDQIEFIAGARYEGQMEEEFKDVTSSTEPELIPIGGKATTASSSTKKKKKKKKTKKTKGAQIWHFEIAGTLKGRRVRVADWMMLRSKKEAVTWRIRIIDFRVETDLLEPDIVEFMDLAFGLRGDEDKKKKKGKR